MIFAAVILQKAKGVTKAKDIRARLKSRLDLWDQGRPIALIDDFEAEARLRMAGPKNQDEEHLFRAYNARVLAGHLRAACRTLTDRDGGGVLGPNDVCTKTGVPVLEALRAKHPPLRDPTSVGLEGGAFEPYDRAPTQVPVVVTADVVEDVASRLSGSSGPSGTDAVELRNWLLRYGGSSAALRSELAALTTWIANSNPPWAAYRALMACRLAALDKQPGVRPVGIGEIYRRLMAKCFLSMAGDRATQACGNYNLCAGIKAGIDGACHVVRDAATAAETAAHAAAAAPPPLAAPPPAPPPGIPYDPEDPHGTACVDARNGFGELSRKAMLWTVRHLWALGARFAFNCYRHASLLVIRRMEDGISLCDILLSMEGVTQGDPLAMALYGLALVPLAIFL